MIKKSASYKKRLSLFELYAKNLKAIKQHPNVHLDPDIDDIFVCPLCFQYFTRDEALTENNELALVTIEHVPPEALGGKVRTLTCGSCNNWAGHNLDSHLTHKLELMDFVQGIPGAAVDAKVTINGAINLNATVNISQDHNIEIFYSQDRSNPKDVERFTKLTEPTPQTINLVFKGKRGKTHKSRRAESSILRIAYLWAFSFFGYGFFINQGLPVIRGQIKDPTANILPHWGISQRLDYPDQCLGINIITAPEELQSFLVVFDLKTALSTQRYGVLLPGPTSPGIGIYETLQNNSSLQTMPITFKPIPYDDQFISNPEFSFASHDIWKLWRVKD